MSGAAKLVLLGVVKCSCGAPGVEFVHRTFGLIYSSINILHVSGPERTQFLREVAHVFGRSFCSKMSEPQPCPAKLAQYESWLIN